MIQAEDLSKQFGNYWAVDGVDLDVKPGQILILLGQNGAGKTTTVRLLTSVLRPSRGWACVAGYDVVKYPEKVRAAVGVLTEHHGLYLRMTGEEYLDYFGKIYEIKNSLRRERIHYLFKYFGISSAANQRIGQYSKGMRQKLSLARALIHEPPVLLFDEPTSAMDPESARLVREAIANLRTENRTIIICTHNLIEAEMLADRVAIIYRGRILVEGTIKDLRNQLLGPPEFEINVNNGMPRGTLNLPVGVAIIGREESKYRLRIEDPQTTNPLLLKNLIHQGVQVVSMQEVPRTLEHVYLAAMSQMEHN